MIQLNRIRLLGMTLVLLGGLFNFSACGSSARIASTDSTGDDSSDDSQNNNDDAGTDASAGDAGSSTPADDGTTVAETPALDTDSDGIADTLDSDDDSDGLDDTVDNNSLVAAYCGDNYRHASLGEVCDDPSGYCSATCEPISLTLVSDIDSIDGSLSELEITEDGSLVVYLASGHLYAVSSESPSAMPDLLAPTDVLDPTIYVISYALSRDGHYVVFNAILDADGVTRLYSYSFVDHTLTVLSQNTGTDTNLAVSAFAIADNSARVVFSGDAELDGVSRLYSVNIAGGTVTSLSQNTGTDTNLDVRDFLISSDSQKVVFEGDPEVNSVDRLYAVNIIGGTVTTLSQNTGTNTALDARDFLISRDSTRVVYKGDTEVDSVTRLYSVAITGGAVTTLSQNTTVDTTKGVDDFVISRDSATVVFSGDTVADTVDRIYAVAITGGTASDVVSSVAIGNSLIVRDLTLTRDGTQVIFIGNTDNSMVDRLNAVSLATGAVTTLSQYTGNDPTYTVNDFSLTGNSNVVVFSGTVVNSGIVGIYAVSLSDASVTDIGGNTTDVNLQLQAYTVAHGEYTLVYYGDFAVDGVFNLNTYHLY